MESALRRPTRKTAHWLPAIAGAGVLTVVGGIAAIFNPLAHPAEAPAISLQDALENYAGTRRVKINTAPEARIADHFYAAPEILKTSLEVDLDSLPVQTFVPPASQPATSSDVVPSVPLPRPRPQPSAAQLAKLKPDLSKLPHLKPHLRVGPKQLRQKLGLSTTEMAAMGWTKTSIVAVFKGHAISVSDALSDKAIVRLPSVRFMDEWTACLETYGFTRLSYRFGRLNNLVRTESGGYPCTVSSGQAMGLTQIMENTVRAAGIRNPFDPKQAIKGATTYLAFLKRRYGGNETLAYAAYNKGPLAIDGLIRQHGPKAADHLTADLQSYVGSAAATPAVAAINKLALK
jgi:hypothetical protein